MTHEKRKPISEQSTEKHEVSVANMICTSTTSSGNLRRKSETRGFEVTGKHSNEDGMVRKSAFVPVRSNALNHGLLDSLRERQKRKLHSLNSENLDSSLNFNETSGKRFKPNESQNSNERNGLLGELKQPHCREEPIYYKQMTCSKLNGFSEKASRKVDFNFNAFSNREHLATFGTNPGDTLARTAQEEIKTSNSQIHPVHLRDNSIAVGEAELRRHGVRNVASVSNNIQSQGITRAEHHNSAVYSRQFISLDSTKSSFLTLIKEMRQTNDTIPCPFCSETFPKYPDLKIHVQTHKYGNNGAAIRQVRPSLNQHQSACSSSGNTPPVSSATGHIPRPPSRRLSTTSVIQFAEKKSN